MVRRQPLVHRIMATAYLALVMMPLLLALCRGKAAASQAEVWLPGGTPSGLAGIHHLLYGHAAAPSGLTFALGIDYASARNMLVVGTQDRLSISRQSLAVVWTLGSALELNLGAVSALATDSLFQGSVAVSILPTFRIKWNATTWRRWAGGLALSWTAPALSSASGTISPADSTYALYALGSRSLAPRWELTVNLGLIYDRASHAGSSVTNPVQLFVDDRNTASRVSIGIGTTTSLPSLWVHGGLGPYAELISEWALRSTRLTDNPVRLSLGSKIFFDAAHAFEADLGVDIRIFGAPRYGSAYAGLPPWSVFAALSYHSRLAALDIGRHDVVYVPTVVRDKNKPTVVVSGYVRDANSLILSEAHLIFGGDANTVLGVDPETGFYQTPPLMMTFSALQSPNARLPIDKRVPQPLDVACSAPGYITEHRLLQPAGPNARVIADFHLQREPPSAVLQLAIFDTKTGKPAAGAKVLISGEYADDTYLTVEHGRVKARMPPGHYTLIITAPGYIVRRSRVELTENAGLIVNIALHRKSALGRRRHRDE